MKKKNSVKNVAMVACTEYSMDPRVRRAAEALADEGFMVDVFVLKEKGGVSFENFNSVNLYYLNQKKYRGNSTLLYMYAYVIFFFRVLKKLSWQFFKKKYSVIHCHNMPDFLVFTAIIPRLFGAKIILDIHDSMPELYRAKSFNPLLRKIFYYLLWAQEKISAWVADLVITVSEPFKREILRGHKINLKKVYIIMNVADPRIFRPTRSLRESKEKGRFKLIYHGTLAGRHGLETVIKGLREIMKNGHNLQFDIYGKGDGYSSLESMIEKLNLQQSVYLHQPVSLNEISARIAEADLGIVSYTPSEATDFMLPSKLMEYIAMEKPVLTVKNKAISYYFSDSDLAYYQADSPQSFIERLNDFVHNSTKQADLKVRMKAFNRRFNWNKEKIKYLNLINTLMS